MSVAVTLPLPVRVRLPLLRVKRKAGASARGVIAMPVGSCFRHFLGDKKLIA